MGYCITDQTVNELIEFARAHPDYDFHTETVDDCLSCIFNRESDDDSFILELDKCN